MSAEFNSRARSYAGPTTLRYQIVPATVIGTTASTTSASFGLMTTSTMLMPEKVTIATRALVMPAWINSATAFTSEVRRVMMRPAWVRS